MQHSCEISLHGHMHWLSVPELLERPHFTAQGFCSNHKGFRRYEEEQGMGPLTAEPGLHAGAAQCAAQEYGRDEALLLAEQDPRGDVPGAKRKAGPKRRHRLHLPSRPLHGGVQGLAHALQSNIPALTRRLLRSMRSSRPVHASPGLRRRSDQEVCLPSLGAWLHQEGASVPQGPVQAKQPTPASSPERSR